MKRGGKILLGGGGIFGIVLIGVVLFALQRQYVEPFPGAVVVLEDSSWHNRTQSESDAGYLWMLPNTVYYKQQKPKGGCALVRRTCQPGTPASPPEILPHVTLLSITFLSEVSHDGQMLFTYEYTGRSNYYPVLYPMSGGKPLEIKDMDREYWLLPPNGRMLVALYEEKLWRRDTVTGKVQTTRLNMPQGSELAQVTPDGRLLLLSSIRNTLQISEIQDDKVVVLKTVPLSKKYATAFPTLSPSGNRILWSIPLEHKNPFDWLPFDFLRQRRFDSLIEWVVTDLDVKLLHTLGTTTVDYSNISANSPEPEWTSDGRGVHFIQDKKLYYLAVP